MNELVLSIDKNYNLCHSIFLFLYINKLQKNSSKVIMQYPPVTPITPENLPAKTVDKQHNIPPTIELTRNGSLL